MTKEKKKEVVKRVMIMLVCALLVGLFAGASTGYAIKSHMVVEASEPDYTVYGSYDDRCVTKEAELDKWKSSIHDFTPIDCDMPEEQQEFAYYLCSSYNIDFKLVIALIQHESNYDPSVISSTGDYGLMQINKNNHAWLSDTLGIDDFLDPYQNMRAGCFTLRKLFERYNNANLVLMAYNMGEEGARRLWENGIFSTDYSKSILDIKKNMKTKQ